MGHVLEMAACLAQSMALRVVLREAAAASPAWQAFFEGPLQQHSQASPPPPHSSPGQWQLGLLIDMEPATGGATAADDSLTLRSCCSCTRLQV